MKKLSVGKFATAAVLGVSAIIPVFPAAATGSELTEYSDLVDCLQSTTESICGLGADFQLTGPLTVTNKITLNLNGHTIGVDADAFTSNKNSGMITVNHGAQLEINGEGTITTGETDIFSAIRLTTKDDTDDTEPAIVNVNNATLEGYYYGIVGSGNAGRGNTKVNLYGAAIKGLNSGDCFGIYQPQLGILNVYDGTTISGAGGIVMKSGDLNVFGGKIIGEGALKDTVPYGNGANPTGAALQIESNDGYSDQMHIRIAGGELISKNGYVIDEYKEKAETVASVQSLSVEGGILTGKTLTGVNDSVIRKQSDNLGKFIKGGSFSYIDKIDTFISSYVAANKSYTYENGYLNINTKIQPKENSLPEGYTTDLEHIDYSQSSDIEQALMRAMLGTKIELPEGFRFVQQENIAILDGDGEEVAELDDEVEFDVVIENIPALAEGYTRKWYVIRSHVFGEEEKTEFIDFEYDETSNTLSFESKYFSAFYIGYVDTEIPVEEPEEPETPDLPKAPNAGFVSPFSSALPVRLVF